MEPDDASGCGNSSILDNNGNSPVGKEGGDSSGGRSIILGDEEDTIANTEIQAKREESPLGASCSQPQVQNEGHEFDRYFEGVSFSRDFAAETLTSSITEAGPQVEGTSNDGGSEFEFAMTDEEFLRFAEQVSFRIRVAGDMESAPLDRRESQTGISNPVRRALRSVARALPDRVSGAEGTTHGASVVVQQESSSSFGDFGLTNDELLEVATRGIVIQETGRETRDSPFERQLAHIAAPCPRQTVHQAQVTARPQGRQTARADTAVSLAPATVVVAATPEQRSAEPRPNLPLPPASDASALTSFGIFLHQQGISPRELFLTADEVAAIRDLPSVPVEATTRTPTSAKPQQAVRNPPHRPEARPAPPPDHASAEAIAPPSPSPASTLALTSSEVANLHRLIAQGAQRGLTDSPPVVPLHSSHPHPPAANAAFVAPAYRTTNTSAQPDAVGMALRGAHRAAVEAARVAPSVVARLRRNGDCGEGWVPPNDRERGG
ncbi:hypothetical protein MMC26_000133 [Xylographa opegraphella]|nr:hypothetical protein [Xylographa opegraphella]